MSTTPDSSLPGATSTKTEANALVGRQAILNEQREVFGYELFDRSAASFTAASDAALLFNALSYAGAEALVGKKLVFINTTHDSLSGGHLELIAPEKVVLEVPPMPAGSCAFDITTRCGVFGALKERGFRIAFDQHALTKDYASWLPLADFIKLDMMHIKAEQLPAVVQFAQKYTKAHIVAEKVETKEQFECMKALGVKLFQGYWFAKPDVIQAKTVRPNQAVIMQLLNLVRSQGSTAEIEALLKKDPTLSFNLLHFINAAGLANEGEVTNFSQAVARLGMQKLFRWAALLMTTSRGSAAPPAVGSTAVVRGRLMELLAADLDMAAEAENAFIAGVFSLLDVMLEQPPAQALESVVLPATVRDALLDNDGPLAPLLAVAKACESGDDEQFAQAANALGLTNHQVNWAHVQALAWADSLE